MASQHKSCTGTSCHSILPPVASTAAARKSAESAKVSSLHAKTELGFLNLATHYQNKWEAGGQANPKLQKKAEKFRKSAVHHNSLGRSMPGKRFTRHRLAKHHTKAGISLE
jgi:hypothetical protein